MHKKAIVSKLIHVSFILVIELIRDFKRVLIDLSILVRESKFYFIVPFLQFLHNLVDFINLYGIALVELVFPIHVVINFGICQKFGVVVYL